MSIGPKSHNPLLVLPSTNPLYLPALINVIRQTFSHQPALKQLLHTHTLTACHQVIHYLPALFSRQISCYLTCLLPLTMSSCLYLGNLTCLLSLSFASACSLSACSLPRLPVPILNVDCARQLGFLIAVHLDLGTFLIKNSAGLDFYSCWVYSHTHYTRLKSKL